MFRPASTLTLDTATAAYRDGLAAIRAGQTTIDLADLTVVDSSAVAALVGWRRAALKQGAELRFINLPANLQSLASLYGVADLLQASRADLPHH